MKLIKFRQLTQAQYNAIPVKDPATYYIITDAQAEKLYLGTALFTSRGIVDVDFTSATGVITFTRNDGTSFNFDLPTEFIFDPARSYYDHNIKSIILVFAEAPSSITPPLTAQEIAEWALEINLDDLGQKILDKVQELTNKLSDGTTRVDNAIEYLVVKFAELAEKDLNGNVITTHYATVTSLQAVINNLANNYLTTAQVNALLDQLKAIYGWEDSVLGTFNNANTFAYSLIEKYDFVLATWKELDTTPIETYTVYFKPSDFIDGHSVRTQIKNNPFRVGFISRLGTTITVGVVDNANALQASDTATVSLTGVKLTPLDVSKVEGANDWLNVDNQDALRIDKFKLAIIDGKLAYQIEEGE